MRILTTSAKDDHLRVLWGEMGYFIETAYHALTEENKGPLRVKHQDIRKIIGGKRDALSYIRGMVASPDSIDSMGGHHIAERGDGIPRTLAVIDEASSVPDEYMPRLKTWANRILVIGNCWPCDNFWKHAQKGKPGTNDKGGDIPRPKKRYFLPESIRDRLRSEVGKEPPTVVEVPNGYYRKIIRIRAQDSPNVRYGMAQLAAGKEPTGEFLVPGVKGYEEYAKQRVLLDPHEQCVILDAEFYEGPELMLYPRLWLNHAENFADKIQTLPRKGKAIGCDPGEGGSDSAWAVVDEFGLIELLSIKTPDTTVIPTMSIALMRKYGIPPERFCIDRGGGGFEHANTLRSMGWRVRTVGFGESLVLDPKRGLRVIEERTEAKEEHYAYYNRRAQMYGELRLLLNPVNHSKVFPPRKGDVKPGEYGFGIPAEYGELRQELAPIPLKYDPEGRLKLPPKNKRSENTNEVCLVELIGHSPDKADALVLACHALLHKKKRPVAGPGGKR